MAIYYDALLLDGPRSGVEVAVAELGRALAELLGPELRPVCRAAAAKADLWLRRAQAVVAPRWARGRLGRIVAEQLWLPRLGSPGDVLHGPAYVLALRWPGPSVVSIYDLVALLHPQWTKPANALHYRAVLPRSARKASVIVVPSQVVADEVVEALGVPGDKVRVIPLGVREAFRSPAPEEDVEAFRRRYGLRRPYFAVVGNIEPKKNVRGVVAAFEIAAGQIPHDLLIAGRPAWRSRRDMAAIARSRMRDRIRLLGRLDDAELRALYSSCTALVQWSLYEGFGLVPLEAMSCGAPVVISDGGALPETAGPAALVVPLGEPEALARAMVRLAEDAALRASLAERGAQWARPFTWQAHARAVVEIYRQVA